MREPAERFRNLINAGIALSVLALTLMLAVVVWRNRFDPVLTEIVTKNFAAIVGLPFAFLGAFVIVALFRQSEGNIEFEALGVKLKGAAGKVVLWVVCFLSICGAIAMLWNE